MLEVSTSSSTSCGHLPRGPNPRDPLLERVLGTAGALVDGRAQTTSRENFTRKHQAPGDRRRSVIPTSTPVLDRSPPAAAARVRPDLEAFVPAKFNLSKDNAGKFRFTLHAPNGQLVASSQAYGSKAAALIGVASVRRNALGAAIDDTTVAPAKSATKATAKRAAKATPAKRAAKATPTKRAARTTAKPAAKRATTSMAKSTNRAAKTTTRTATTARVVVLAARLVLFAMSVVRPRRGLGRGPRRARLVGVTFAGTLGRRRLRGTLGRGLRGQPGSGHLGSITSALISSTATQKSVKRL